MNDLLETIKLIKLGADWSDFALKKIDDVEKAVKVLEIIVKKNVDTAKLKLCFMLFDIEKDEEEMNVYRCEHYNNGQCVEDKLSLVEFKMLMEVLGNDRG